MPPQPTPKRYNWFFFDSSALQNVKATTERDLHCSQCSNIITTYTSMGAAVWQAYGTSDAWYTGGSSFAVSAMKEFLQRHLDRAVTYHDRAIAFTGDLSSDLLFWVSRSTGPLHLEVELVLGKDANLTVETYTTKEGHGIRVHLANAEGLSASSAGEVVKAIMNDADARGHLSVHCHDRQVIIQPHKRVKLYNPSCCVIDAQLPTRLDACCNKNPQLLNKVHGHACFSFPQRVGRWQLNSDKHKKAIQWANGNKPSDIHQDIICKYAEYCLSVEQAGEPGHAEAWVTSEEQSDPGYQDALKQALQANPFTRGLPVVSI